MMNKSKLCLLSVVMVLVPIVSLAGSEVNSDMSRDVWLEAVKRGVSAPVCKSFTDDESIATQMTARHITYDKCVALMPAIAEKCEKKYFSELPMVINDQNAEKWGRILGECIGNDFAMSYLSTDEVSTSAGEHQ